MTSHPAAHLSSKADAFRFSLLSWYRTHRRRLPWRESPSVYKTVVSEFMLQQTQVKTVLPYFDRWLHAFPSFEALANAAEADVLKLWEGLGYYSRARNLHRLAQTVAARPEMPRTPEAWLHLPGVGPYTAAAVTSIGFGVPVACVDGNVVRILARLTADGTRFRDSATASKAFTSLASVLVSQTEPGDHNQAMMELGATVCTKSGPLCTICPVFEFCAGRKTGDPERYPRLAPKQIESVSVTRVWCVSDGKLLLHRAGQDARRFANIHEVPTAEQVGLAPDAFQAAPPLLVKKRGITRYSITESFHRVMPEHLRASEQQQSLLVWVPLGDLEKLTLSGPHRRWSRELLQPPIS